MKLNSIICGDAVEEMKKLPANSIDTIITDPPYGLGFMNKEWDNPAREQELIEREKRRSEQRFREGKSPTTAPFSQSVRPGLGIKRINNVWYQKWTKKWATEALRVAKPGATLLCFGGTRTYHRLACAIEDAGWILKDCIMWIYGSGFPKATDISKQLDKRAGKEIENKSEFTEFSAQTDTTKHIKRYKKCKQCGKLLYGQDPCKCEWRNPKGQTEEAKLWNGWKSHGLKPAYEPIIVAIKPNEGSYAQNALKYGVAGLNIDGGRIGTEEEIGRDNTGLKGSVLKPSDGWNPNSMIGLDTRGKVKGRYPANIILDSEAAKLLDEMSGETSITGKRRNPDKFDYASPLPLSGRTNKKKTEYPNDKGGASRFFKVIK